MTKTLTIKDSSRTLELGGVSVENDLQNQIESFQKPNQSGGSKETRALNLNQIEEIYTVTALMDDRATDKLNTGISTKEGAKTRFKDIVVSGEHLTFEYGGETVKGYVTKLNIKEVADDDTTKYRFQFNFLEAVPMTS